MSNVVKMSDATLCIQVSRSVRIGMCIGLSGNGEVLYDGPIGAGPMPEAATILLSPQDFQDYESFVENKRSRGSNG